MVQKPDAGDQIELPLFSREKIVRVAATNSMLPRSCCTQVLRAMSSIA
jgi:hypothetical protein